MARDLYPSSKRTGDTEILREANFQKQEIWHDFCYRSFIWPLDLTRV